MMNPDFKAEGASAALVIAGLAASSATPIEAEALQRPGSYYLVPNGTGGKEFMEAPVAPLHTDRASNSRIVTNDAAFIAYVNRHGDAQTEVWADQAGNKVVGVIDAHQAVDADGARFGWERHKVTLKLEHTPAWEAWVGNQGLKRQADFAEHVEEYAEHVYVPTGGELLEIAQTLQGTRNADFSSGSKLSTGESSFQYTEQIKGQAGKSGQLVIPEEFELGLAPYIGGAAYKVVAKLRWRLDNGSVTIGYKLIGIDRILEEAFKEITETITAGVEFPVFHGRP